MAKKSSRSLLILFNTVFLYGMERSVIQTFDLLQPSITPYFMLSYTTRRCKLPLLTEIEERELKHFFLSDHKDWPRFGKPTSLQHFWELFATFIQGNIDMLKISRKMDMLYVPSISYFFFGFLTVLSFRLSGKRVIYGFHDLILRRSWYLWFASLFITDFAHHNRWSLEAVARENPYILRCNNFSGPFYARSCASEIVTQSNSQLLAKKYVHLLFIGQVSWHKGVDLLIDAFCVLGEKYPDLVLHIVGGWSDAPFKQKLEEQLMTHHLLERVTFWGYQHEVQQYLHTADIYIHPSPPSRFQESFGRGVAEAMSAGLPTVCFCSGALPMLVIHEQTGMLCSDETVQSLIENIEHLLTNQTLRNRCGQQALAHYQANYSGEVVRSKWLDFLAS